MGIVVKILGFIDLLSALAFLMLTFGMEPYVQFIIFCAGLLLIKGMFILMGDILSFIDLISAILLFISIFFSLPVIIFWAPAFLLLAKGFTSFF